MKNSNYCMILFAALQILLYTACGTHQSAVLKGAPPPVSVTDLPSLIGTYPFVNGDTECTKILQIIQDDPAIPNTLSAYGQQEPDQNKWPIQSFNNIGGEGVYSYNSSVSEWTWSQAAVEGESIILKDARAYFVKSSRILATEKSRITIVGDILVFSGRLYSPQLRGPKPFTCNYRVGTNN